MKHGFVLRTVLEKNYIKFCLRGFCLGKPKNVIIPKMALKKLK